MKRRVVLGASVIAIIAALATAVPAFANTIGQNINCGGPGVGEGWSAAYSTGGYIETDNTATNACTYGYLTGFLLDSNGTYHSYYPAQPWVGSSGLHFGHITYSAALNITWASGSHNMCTDNFSTCNSDGYEATSAMQ